MRPATAPVSGDLLADRAYSELRDRIVTLAIPPWRPDQRGFARA